MIVALPGLFSYFFLLIKVEYNGVKTIQACFRDGLKMLSLTFPKHIQISLWTLIRIFTAHFG